MPTQIRAELRFTDDCKGFCTTTCVLHDGMCKPSPLSMVKLGNAQGHYLSLRWSQYQFWHVFSSLHHCSRHVQCIVMQYQEAAHLTGQFEECQVKLNIKASTRCQNGRPLKDSYRVSHGSPICCVLHQLLVQHLQVTHAYGCRRLRMTIRPNTHMTAVIAQRQQDILSQCLQSWFRRDLSCPQQDLCWKVVNL